MDCSKWQVRVPNAVCAASPSHDIVRVEGANMTLRTVGKAALLPLQPYRCTQPENEQGNGRRNLFFPLAIGPPPSPDFNVVRRTMFKTNPAIFGVALNIDIGGKGGSG